MQREKLTPRAQEMYLLIEKYFTTDLNQKTFCKQEDIAYSTFHWWLAQYRQKESAQAVSNNKNRDDFLPIHVTPSKLSNTQPTPCQIEYPNGIVVRLDQVNVQLIRQLVQLEST